MTSPKSILHLGLCHYPKVRNKSQKVSRSFQKCVLSLSVMFNSDPSPPGFSVHGIFQARILEWVAIFLLQGIFPTQALNPRLLCLQHWQAGSLPLAPLPGISALKSPVCVHSYFS